MKANIKAPAGFGYYARRLNRHTYHLFKLRGGDKSPLCGRGDEIAINSHAMEYLLPYDSHKRCTDCLGLAGEPEQVAEVQLAQAAHEQREQAHAERMRAALGKLGDFDDLSGLTADDLRLRLQDIRRVADDALAPQREAK